MPAKLLCINPKGVGDLHELRARRLTRNVDAEVTFYNVDRKVSYPAAMRALNQLIGSQKWDLIYQESTGIIGGINLIQAALTRGQRFVVSTGDPIGGYFHVTKGPLVGGFFDIYERLLYRTCTGFIGWTPYLTGAALKLGARSAVTIEGAADLSIFRPFAAGQRLAVRRRYGLQDGHLVCGVVGSLRWSERQKYSYGLELVEVLKRVRRDDISILIIGDGTGRTVLEGMIPTELKSRAVFTGRLAENEVVEAMNAMDIGFVTQTLDQLGNFRLTTKLPEYLACGLPVGMSPIPGFYDYAAEAGWPLPKAHPADQKFHAECATWLDQLSWDDVRAKASSARRIAEERFDNDLIGRKFCRYVESLLDEGIKK